MPPITRLLPLALIAASVATLCDWNHAYTGALSYPDPAFGIQAWWVFPGFVLAFTFMGATYGMMAKLLKGRLALEQSTSPASVAPFVEALSAFAMVYLASGWGNAHPNLMNFVFLLLFVIRWEFTYEKGWLLIVAVALAIGGIVAEGALGAVGLVAYGHQEIFYCPWWLAGVYLHGAFALREGMRFMVYRQSAKNGRAPSK